MMEATPTFALPNQFLVWVAKKVLAQSDLDLVLTEYYKERLESRLKNRETHTNGLILTESTDTTGLRIPTDWNSCTKLSSTRPFPFAPSLPLFPLFLSSNVAPLPATAPITSSSLFQSHSYPPLLCHPRAKPLLVSEMTDTTKDNKMSEEGTPTPNSMPLASVMQVPYIITMP